MRSKLINKTVAVFLISLALNYFGHKAYSNESAPRLLLGPIVKSSGLRFNGIDNYVTIENSRDPLDLIGPVTIECWINPDETNTGRIYFISRQTYDLCLSGLYPVARIVCVDGGKHAVSSKAPISADEWHHVAMTYDGISRLCLYVDGRLVAEENNCTGNLVSAFWVTNFGTARYMNHFFAGVIDEVRISNTVRDVPAIWEKGTYYWELEPDENTVGLWHFNEMDGELVLDSTDNGIVGKRVNDPVYVEGYIPEISGHTFDPGISVTILNGIGISSWLLSESIDIPSGDDPGWTIHQPKQYELKKDDYGRKTIYCWMKDKNGNIINEPLSSEITYFKK